VVTVIGPDLKDVKVLGMRVSFSEETPGLGERIKEKPAANSILGLALGRPSLARVKSDAVPVTLVRVLGREGDSVKVEYDSPGAGVQQRSVPSSQIQFLDFVPWFQEQFSGLHEGDLKLKKDGGRVDGITGATISSRASLGAVTEAVRRIKASVKPQAAGESN
jgi:Na+-translocating ferredoxin:NAD+ oxidoreductase RnfG subunit